MPPTNWNKTSRLSILLRGLFVIAALAAVGWIGGVLSGRWREAWVAALPGRIRNAEPGEMPELLAKGRLYAVSQPDRPALTANLAFATLLAADRSPRRMGYYGNAARLLETMETAEIAPGEAFAINLMASGVHAETGDYAKAFTALAQADEALNMTPESAERRRQRLLLVNAQAYYLATAPEGAGRNPERALHLAQLMMTSKDEPPGDGYSSAAFFDTLAAAWHAAGNAERALAAQTFALSLADTSGLDVYIKHYDEYAAVEMP